MSNLKNRNRSLKLSATLISALLLVSGCGTDPQLESLEANCPTILQNLTSISTSPKIFEGSEFANAGYLATNLGQDSRKSAEKEILLKFPYLDKLVVGRPKSGSNWDNVYRNAAAIYIIQQALTGTSINFPRTDEQVKEIIERGKHDQDVEPLARELFGDHSSEVQSGCGLVDPQGDIYSSWMQARDLLWDFGDYLQVARDCATSGYNFEYIDQPCARVDYVSEPIDWTPTPTDPWTRTWNDDIQEGLAKFTWCWNKGLTYSSATDACI